MLKLTNNIMLIYKWIILAIALWNVVVASVRNEGRDETKYFIKGIFWVLWSIAITN